MAQPPLMKAPKFGAWLAEQWDNLTLQQVVNKLKPFLGPEGEKLGRSNIKKWIDGRVPSWAALLAMSAAFQWPIGEVLVRLSDELARERDLPCQSGTTTSSLSKEDTVADDLAAATRTIEQLERRLADLEGLAEEAQSIATRLLKLAVRDGETEAARSPQPKGARRTRKARH